MEFNCTLEELKLISKIANRAIDSGVTTRDKMNVSMDLEACHSNGCRLKLQELLDASDGTFNHDINGIETFIDRETGKLFDGFLPRCSE